MSWWPFPFCCSFHHGLLFARLFAVVTNNNKRPTCLLLPLCHPLPPSATRCHPLPPSATLFLLFIIISFFFFFPPLLLLLLLLLPNLAPASRWRASELHYFQPCHFGFSFVNHHFESASTVDNNCFNKVLFSDFRFDRMEMD